GRPRGTPNVPRRACHPQQRKRGAKAGACGKIFSRAREGAGPGGRSPAFPPSPPRERGAGGEPGGPPRPASLLQSRLFSRKRAGGDLSGLPSGARGAFDRGKEESGAARPPGNGKALSGLGQNQHNKKSQTFLLQWYCTCLILGVN